MSIENDKLGLPDINCFRVMLKTDVQIQRPIAKNMRFGFRNPQNVEKL